MKKKKKTFLTLNMKIFSSFLILFFCALAIKDEKFVGRGRNEGGMMMWKEI